MTEPETIETEVAEIVGQALEVSAPYASTSVNLFRTEDPNEIIRRATDVANALKGVLVDKELTKRIGKKEHVLVEGWTLCGTMLGVFPVCVWTKPVREDQGWEARVEARTLSGAVVGAAEAECLRSEKEWGPNPTRGGMRDDFALRSMAQTRATSKALRQPLGFIVTLAGFEATPAEEMSPEYARSEGGLGDANVPKTWAQVRAWYDEHGGPGAWVLAEEMCKAYMIYQHGTEDSKSLTKEERQVVLQKAAGATVWLAEHDNTPMGPAPSIAHYQEAWAHVLGGVFLEGVEWKASDYLPADEDAEQIADETVTGPPA